MEHAKKYHYFYEFKNNMHCICATLAKLPLEYCGIKGTAESKAIALQQIEMLNK